MPEPTRGVQPETDYSWIELDDFTAGCYDYTSISGGTPNVPAPKGAADATQTFACIALPSGGLGPLPGVAQAYSWPLTNGTTTYLVGLLVHDELNDGTTEAVIIGEYDNGTNHIWGAASYILETTTATSIVETTEASAVGIFGSPYPQFTRASPLVEVTGVTLDGTTAVITVVSGGWPGVAVGDYATVVSGTGTIPADTTVQSIAGNDLTLSGPTTASGTATVGFTDVNQPGNPVVVFPSGGPAQPTTAGALYMYPNPQTPTSYTPYDMIPLTPSQTGQVIVHQHRIIVLSGINFPYPAGGGFLTNEQINFTDPPNSQVLGFQQTVLAAEEPYGYGAGGSQSAGELFLVKKRGGGLIVSGDIFSPSVTFFPGIQPTGGFYGSASSGVTGFYYCSANNGAWVWNGGNTSMKISKQLDDSFFLPAEFSTMDSNNYGFYCRCIGDKVYFSNNWLFDTRTGGWWKYYPDESQGGTNLFWVNEVDGPDIYAAVLSFPDSNKDFLFRFDQTIPQENYQWQSLPIRLTTNRFVELRQVVVRASSNSGNTASTVKVSVYNGTTEVGSVTTPSSQIGEAPTMIRMPIGSTNAGSNPYASEDLTIRITGMGNSGAAPNVHSVSLGYKQITQAPTIGVSS